MRHPDNNNCKTMRATIQCKTLATMYWAFLLIIGGINSSSLATDRLTLKISTAFYWVISLLISNQLASLTLSFPDSWEHAVNY